MLRDEPTISSSLYRLPKDPVAAQVLIPSFRQATCVRGAFGWFSAGWIARVAPGLATYLARNDVAPIRFTIAPVLYPEEYDALKQVIDAREHAIRRLAEVLEGARSPGADALAKHAVDCLAWMVAKDRLRIRVAVVRSDSNYHPKVWIFSDDKDSVAVRGSANATGRAYGGGVEHVDVDCTWEDSTRVSIAAQMVEDWWLGRDDAIELVFDLPQALRDVIVKLAPSVAPTEGDYANALRQSKAAAGDSAFASERNVLRRALTIPVGLQWKVGEYGHQGEAVRAWEANGRHGILEMATGAGKTITAMVCATRLQLDKRPLLVVVAAPYVPLIQQWCEEVEVFGLKPVNFSGFGGEEARGAEVQRIARRLRMAASDCEVIVVSHDTISTRRFQDDLRAVECSRLLVADEVHNLGAPSFVTRPPDFFEFRLGLSATPVRQYDQQGTQALIDYFGKVVFQFTLEQAIGKCLVGYDYFVHPVALTHEEMDSWRELTAQIRQNAWRETDGKPDEFLTKLLRRRRLVLETAAGKLSELAQLLNEEDLGALRHTLIYATDKAPEQLESINRLLISRGILFHQLTAEETSNREQTRRIIRAFQAGELQVLTAKRVLDEGVNIPQISKAFILASTTVERQWVQRRGRLLRTCSAIGKSHSVIHDLVAIPPHDDGPLDPDARAVIRAELRRATEFARLANNAGRTDGPLAVLDQLANAAYL